MVFLSRGIRRHQIPALAAAGYRSRGTGYARLRGINPEEIEAYTISNLVGDVAQAVIALGEFGSYSWS